MPPDPTDEMEGAPGEAGRAEQARTDEPVDVHVDVDVDNDKTGLRPLPAELRDDRPFDEEFQPEGTQTLALDDDAIEMLEAGAAPVVPVRASTVLSAVPPPPPPPPPRTLAQGGPGRASPDGGDATARSVPSIDDTETNEFETNPLTQALSVDDVEILAQEAPKAEVPPAPPREPTVVDRALEEARADAWDKRAAELRDELQRETDRARVALLAYELGELAERRLHDEAGAVKSYGRALQADPSLRPNLWAIRRVFYRRALWPNLIKLIDAEVRFARDPREQADLLVEKGRILEDRTKDLDGAKASYDRAVALDAGSRAALLARERIALAERDDASLAVLWRQLADAHAAPSRKVGYLVDLAKLQARMGDAAAGLATIREAAAIGTDRERVARERERLAEAAGDTQAFLDALDARIALVAEAFGPAGPTGRNDVDLTPRERRLRHEIVALRRRQARVAREAGDADRAWQLVEAARAIAPEEPLLLYDLADLAEETGRFDDLAGALGGLVALETDPARALALSLRRADALGRAGKGTEADQILDGIVAQAPGYLAVTDLRLRRALEAGAWERIAQLYLAEANAARMGTAFGPSESDPDAEWAAGAYVAAGDVYDVRLGLLDEARAAYGQALETLPACRPALEALCSLHEREGRWDDAAALIEKQLEAGPSDDLLERLAALREQQGHREGALAALLRLAERRPDDLTLRFHLDDLLAECGRQEERAELLGRLAERVDDPERQAAIHLEHARVLEDELDRPAEAVAAVRRALALTPGDRAARSALGALLRRTERWEELVAERRAEAREGGPGAARALREAAAILERKLGRPEEAAAVYRELYDAAPDDDAALRSLAGALADDHAALAGVLERESSLVQGPSQARELTRLGDLYEALERDDDAAGAWRRARESGDTGHAGWALIGLASRAGDTATLAEAMSGLAAASSDPAFADDLTEETAWLEMEDASRARARLEEIAARAPDRRGAQLGRSLLAARSRDAAGLAEALSAQADRTADRDAGAALLLRAATLVEVLDAREGPAGSAGQSGAAGDTRRRASELAVRALALRPDDAGAILSAAERPAVPGGDPEARTDLLMRRAALAADADMRAALDMELAVELERSGLLAHAGLVLAGILRGDAEHLPALLSLRRIARRANDRETLARVSLRLGRVLVDPASSAEALAEAATILDESGQEDLAAPIWRELLDHVPDHAKAYERTHWHLAAADDAQALHELLSHRLRHVVEPTEETPYRLERAAIRRRLGDFDGARADLERVLELDARSLEALESLAEIEVAGGRAREAAGLYERFLHACDDATRRAPVELRLSGVLCEQIGDYEGAVGHLEHALAARPADEAARERLVDVLVRLGDHERAAAELEVLSAGRTEVDVRARDELRAAQLLRTKLGDYDRAKRALERARRLDPLSLEIVKELLECTGPSGREAVLQGAIADARSELAASPTDPQAYERLCRLGDLAGDDDLVFLGAGVLLALGSGSTRRAMYTSRRQAAGAGPPRLRRPLSEDDWRSRIEHADARGPLAELWQVLAEAASRLDPHEPAQLGFTKVERIAPKALAKQAPVVDGLAKAMGLGEIELWVSARKPGFARAVALETPLVLLGEDVARAETLELRFLLGKTLAEARRRSAPLEEMPLSNLALLVAAAVKLAGGDPARIPALSGSLHTAGHVEERAKSVQKVMSKKDRKALPLVVDRLAQAQDLAVWVDAMRMTCRRAGLLVCGDVGAALPGGAARRNVASDPLCVDLLAWAVGEEHLALRKELVS